MVKFKKWMITILVYLITCIIIYDSFQPIMVKFYDGLQGLIPLFVLTILSSLLLLLFYNYVNNPLKGYIYRFFNIYILFISFYTGSKIINIIGNNDIWQTNIGTVIGIIVIIFYLKLEEKIVKKYYLIYLFIIFILLYLEFKYYLLFG